MFDIQKVLQMADLLDYVSKAGGKLAKHGDRYSCACPLHGGDNVTAFSIYKKDGRDLWNCFTGDCGGGDVITFVEMWQFSGEPDKKERFKKACEFITGEKTGDPVAMEASARARHEAAEREMIAAQEREAARRSELQQAERHLLYNQNLKNNSWMRETWTKWGIDDGMQDFWYLGGCDDFFVDGEYHSPTLTIPIFNEQNELMTLRHRILSPKDQKDKYRPDRTGLRSHPFLALHTMGFDGGIIWVMEGEKKAMVTWTRADSDWQCIGVPGQEMYKHLVDVLRPVAERVIVVPDPAAELKAYHLAKEIGAKFLQLPEKIDDFILSTDTKQNDLYRMSKQARRA